MTQSSCKHDTKYKSYPRMRLVPVRVFSYLVSVNYLIPNRDTKKGGWLEPLPNVFFTLQYFEKFL